MKEFTEKVKEYLEKEERSHGWLARKVSDSGKQVSRPLISNGLSGKQPFSGEVKTKIIDIIGEQKA